MYDEIGCYNTKIVLNV